MSSQFTEADAIRILVATDNHVGYEERDPIRKNDSWRTFDEVINLARKEDVDMVLLAGDLFHDNKPSRQAMFQVMRTLRKNCLGMKPCELQFMSDGNEVFAGAFSHVNYEDPDINISIPVFSIHGNHDDPTGDDYLCSLDLLQVAGLVNYFGRIQEVDNIQAKPILLQKGQTKLALYGLSNVRDERMHRSFRDNQVKWFRPNVQSSDWFNLLAVHQNHYAHTPTSYLPESFLPEWLDLVVWGHEHECLIDPAHNPEAGFHVMQPGSSVATSLVPGEAVAKHVAIVTVTGKDFKIEKRRLKTVRPFVTREVVLAKDDRFKGLDKKKDNQQELTRKLMVLVEEMIVEANKDWESMHDGILGDQERPLPLIRLKVDYTPPEGGHYECENPQRFSNRFLGKVANTNDVVYFHRKKKTSNSSQIDKVPDEVLQAMGLDAIEVDRLVNEYLENQTLRILPQAPFGDAVSQFVSKQDKHAMEEFVKDSLSSQMKQMMSLGDDDDDDDDDAKLESVMEKCKKRLEEQFKAGLLKQSKRVYKPKPDNWDSDMDGHWLDQEGAVEYEPEAAGPPWPTRSRSRGSTPIVSDENEELEDEEMEDAESEEVVPKKRGRPKAAAAKPTPAKKAPAKKAPAKTAAKTAPAKKAPTKGRGRKTGPFLDSDEEDDVFMDDDNNAEEAAPPPKRAAAMRSQPSRSQPSRGAPMTQTKLNFSQRGSQNQPLEVSDDMISDDDDDPFEPMPAKNTGRRR